MSSLSTHKCRENRVFCQSLHRLGRQATVGTLPLPTPVPLVFRNAEKYYRQANQQKKVFADLSLQYFGLKSPHGNKLILEVLDKADVLNAAGDAVENRDKHAMGF